MSKEYGYIKVYRSLLENPIWKDKPYSKGQAWLELMMLANHTDKKVLINGKINTVERGQLFTNRRELADRWGWSIKKVDNFIKLLKTEKMVTVKGTTNGTTLTIENYGFYQSKGDTKGSTEDTAEGTPEDTAEDTAEGTPEDTAEDTAEGTQNKKKRIKNNKNNKRNNNITPKTDVLALIVAFSDDVVIQNLLQSWLNIRKAKRMPMTEDVIKSNLDSLERVAKDSGMTVIEYLNEVKRRSWGTFFPIESKKTETKEKPPKNEASYDLKKFSEQDLYGEIKYERKNKQRGKPT